MGSRLTAAERARERAFWANLLERRARSGALRPHSGAGYRHRRFVLVRDAAWITLYRSATPDPQIGVFLRCKGLAGEAFFAMADQARAAIEPRLHAVLDPGTELAWDSQHRPGMKDIIGFIAAPLPWDDAASEWHIPWLLQKGAVWWNVFDSLAGRSAMT